MFTPSIKGSSDTDMVLTWRVHIYTVAALLAFSGAVQAANDVNDKKRGFVRREQVTEKARQQRIRNRVLLLKTSSAHRKKRITNQEQKEQTLKQSKLMRIHNKEQLLFAVRRRNPDRLNYFSGPENPASDSESEEAWVKTAIKRLKGQLGKPYVWGGETSAEGFDCSGLINYAYNPLLERKLPRTANAMFRDPALKHIPQNSLRRGDLIFFGIHQRSNADHVGVYLGDGQFIEAPRTGLNVRMSRLTEAFWQEHYLGARRVVTKN